MPKYTTDQSNHEKDTLKIYWGAVWRAKPLFLRTLTYPLSTIAINVVMPLLVSLTLAALATGRTDVGGYLITLAFVALFGVLNNWYGMTNFLKLQAKTQADMLELATSTLLRRGVSFHTNNIGGKLVNNALQYPAASGHLLDSLFVNMLPFLVIMTTGISIIASRSWPMGLALLFIVTTLTTLTIIESRKRAAKRAERKVVQNNMVAHVSDTIVNAQTVKMFGREHHELHTHSRLSEKLQQLRFIDWSKTVRSGSIRMGTLLALEICLIAFIGYLVQRDPGVLAIGIFSFSYMITLTNRLFEIGTMIRNIEESFLEASSMTEILLQDTEIVDKPGAKKLHVAEGLIEMRDVDFAYHDESSSEKIFENLNLAIPTGQKIGLVGPSGGGKSTLTRLLLRFDDVDKGYIAIDDQVISDVTQASLRHAISYVPQEPLLFHRSIFENIAYGNTKATLYDVKKAATLAFADGFIGKLPKGYDTIVGERGVKLSGGQRQRVAIARAILKDAPILVLDEATSALDSESKVFIQKALAGLMQGRTTIVIAHRLSTIQKMDRIIVLEDGAVVEDGPHKKLMKRSGLYAKLWAHQSGGFIEE